MTVTKTSVLVLDCAEPAELAEFYSSFLGAEIRVGRDPDFLEIIGHAGFHLAVRRDHGYMPASWPRPESPQEPHLRFMVSREEIDEAERELIALGARPLDTKDNGGPRDTRLYSDPAGHPFTLAVLP
ncbi:MULTISPECIES: VOC family protein [unclassified Streptomyces]|uniref:VOC family protein n=1 Tax=unclassified Streptomyces TaxID=2593676 RepID=UPI00081EADC4|nr:MULTISPECIES: VOC family protein [unclassified Streptomyces]MYZ36334.1 VOC family protein [Streptomyces sp. SID4917]SCF82748.1 hypothetical protein GA0115259_1032314 [Streptomyces sp. MnatMP-M17]